MKNSELTEEQLAQRRKAVNKYHAKYIEMRLRVTPEEHGYIQSHATSMGESVAAFLRRAVKEAMERDKNR